MLHALFAAMSKGFSYAVQRTQNPHTKPAYELALSQFQTYPANNVQGGGTLTGHNNWRVTQVPQVLQLHNPIDSGMGGTYAGQIISQPLIDQSATTVGA